jgi:hypothetical protein
VQIQTQKEQFNSIEKGMEAYYDDVIHMEEGGDDPITTHDIENLASGMDWTNRIEWLPITTTRLSPSS